MNTKDQKIAVEELLLEALDNNNYELLEELKTEYPSIYDDVVNGFMNDEEDKMESYRQIAF